MISSELSYFTGDKFRFSERESSFPVPVIIGSCNRYFTEPDCRADTMFASVVEELFLFPLVTCSVSQCPGTWGCFYFLIIPLALGGRKICILVWSDSPCYSPSLEIKGKNLGFFSFTETEERHCVLFC